VKLIKPSEISASNLTLLDESDHRVILSVRRFIDATDDPVLQETFHSSISLITQDSIGLTVKQKRESKIPD
jgi:hypothetical protein